MIVDRYKPYILILLLAVVGLLSSCTIKEDVYFNKDLSGTRQIGVDMSDAMKWMSIGDDKNNSKDQFAQSLREREGKLDSNAIRFNAMPGIYNATTYVDPDNYTLSWSYQFIDIRSLNDSYPGADKVRSIVMGRSAHGGEVMQDEPAPGKIVLEGKTLQFKDACMEWSDEDQEALQDELKDKKGKEGLMTLMGSMFTQEVTLHFKKKVKQVYGRKVILVDKHTVRVRYNMQDFKDNANAYDITVELK